MAPWRSVPDGADTKEASGKSPWSSAEAKARYEKAHQERYGVSIDSASFAFGGGC